jgi:capsular polysaccharide biosynthesis protein
VIPRIYQLENTSAINDSLALTPPTEATAPAPMMNVTARENTQKEIMEIWHYFQIVGRWLWLILLCTVVAALVGFAVSTYLMVPLYRAATTLMVKTSGLTNENAVDSRGNDYDTFLANEYLTATFKELAQKRPVAELAAQALNMDLAQLYGHIQIDATPKTPLIVLSFESSKADQALSVTAAFAATLIQVAHEREWMPGRELTVIEPAILPQSPSSPRIWLNTAVAALAGGVLALAGIFLLEYSRFVKHVG